MRVSYPKYEKLYEESASLILALVLDQKLSNTLRILTMLR